MSTLTCTTCGKAVDPLAVFPKGNCLDCHARIFDRDAARFGLPAPDFSGVVNTRAVTRLARAAKKGRR